MKRKTIKLESGEKWELCETVFYYCPVHGKCPAILERVAPNGVELVKTAIGTQGMFFCKKCGMVKMVNVWNNCVGLTDATLESE